MVGLTIVLETTNTLSNGLISPKPHQIVNKSAVMATTIASAAKDTASLRRGSFCPDSGFLEHCFFCRMKLLPAKDIYMYKGDRAFCSGECRSKQMIIDEGSLRKEICSLKAKSDSPASSQSSSSGVLHVIAGIRETQQAVP